MNFGMINTNLILLILGVAAAILGILMAIFGFFTW